MPFNSDLFISIFQKAFTPERSASIRPAASFATNLVSIYTIFVLPGLFVAELLSREHEEKRKKTFVSHIYFQVFLERKFAKILFVIFVTTAVLAQQLVLERARISQQAESFCLINLGALLSYADKRCVFPSKQTVARTFDR